MTFRVGDHVELVTGDHGYITAVKGSANPEQSGGAGCQFTVQKIGGGHTRVPYEQISHRLADPQFEPGSDVRFGDQLAQVAHQVGREVRLRLPSGFRTVPAHEVALENGGDRPQT